VKTNEDIDALEKRLIRSDDARFQAFKKVDDDLRELRAEIDKLRTMNASLAVRIGELCKPPKHEAWFAAPNEGLPL
jgi:hypothetical protein